MSKRSSSSPHAADVIVVVVGQQDRDRAQAFRHRLRAPGRPRPDRPRRPRRRSSDSSPDVVVGEGGQGCNGKHAVDDLGRADCRRIATMPPAHVPTSTRRPPPRPGSAADAGRQLLARSAAHGDPGADPGVRPRRAVSCGPSAGVSRRSARATCWPVCSACIGEGDGLRGAVRPAIDPELPIATASLSLVYALFVFESLARTRRRCWQEIARVLKPEGVGAGAHASTRGAWSACAGFRARVASIGPARRCERMARDAGLDVMRQQLPRPVSAAAPAAVGRRQPASPLAAMDCARPACWWPAPTRARADALAQAARQPSVCVRG